MSYNRVLSRLANISPEREVIHTELRLSGLRVKELSGTGHKLCKLGAFLSAVCGAVSACLPVCLSVCAPNFKLGVFPVQYVQT